MANKSDKSASREPKADTVEEPEGAAPAPSDGDPVRGSDDKGETPEPSTVGLPGAFEAGMPEVQPHAIAAHKAEQAELESKYAGMIDAAGETFDPEAHAVDGDGNPKKTKAGNWAKKRGRKSVSENASVGRVGGKLPEKAPEQIAREKSFATGRFAAGSLIQLGIMIGGDEWHPIKDAQSGIDERAALESAFGEYFAANDMTDFPPGVALAIAVGGYALPRMAAPKTRSRLGKVKDWIAEKYLAFRRKRTEKREKALAGRNAEKSENQGE